MYNAPKTWFLVPKFPKIPHRGRATIPPPTPSPSVVSHTQSLKKSCSPYPPPPPMWGKNELPKHIWLCGQRWEIRAKIVVPPQMEMVPYAYDTGVLVGGGGLGGALAPPPQMKLIHDLFSMYQQNIERNSSLRMWKCQNFLSSLAPLARIHIHLINVSVCRYTVVYICFRVLKKYPFPGRSNRDTLTHNIVHVVKSKFPS